VLDRPSQRRLENFNRRDQPVLKDPDSEQLRFRRFEFENSGERRAVAQPVAIVLLGDNLIIRTETERDASRDPADVRMRLVYPAVDERDADARAGPGAYDRGIECQGSRATRARNGPAGAFFCFPEGDYQYRSRSGIRGN
jgi:hypothetical protein